MLIELLKEIEKDIIPPVELIEEAEEKLGVKLPENLLKIVALRKHFWFVIGKRVELIEFTGIEAIAQSDSYCKEWEMKEGLVLFSGDGHYWFALDCREVKDGDLAPVVYVVPECDTMERVAEDFNEFLEKLKSSEEVEELFPNPFNKYYERLLYFVLIVIFIISLYFWRVYIFIFYIALSLITCLLAFILLLALLGLILHFILPKSWKNKGKGRGRTRKKLWSRPNCK